MKTLFLIYLALMALAILFVSECSVPPAPVGSVPDSLALQHRLSHSVDSVDSLYIGCVWQEGMCICPDLKPPGPP